MRAIELIFNDNNYFKYGTTEFGGPDALDIPVNMIAEDRPEVLEEIELEENLRREDLTPMEQALAIARLHKMKTKDHPTQTLKDTAGNLATLESKPMTGTHIQRVTNSILVEQMKDDPDVQLAAKTSLAKAAKIAKQKIERIFVQTLQGLEHQDDTGIYDPLFKVVHADLFVATKALRPKTVDILFFDPPYGMGADKFGEQSMALGHEYEDSMDAANSIILFLAKQSEFFMKDNGHLLMFCNYENFEHWKAIWKGVGWKVWPRPLIWSKGSTSHAPQPNYGPKYSYECILFARKGDRQVTQNYL